jgi:putative ABC transport system ATP-binding protein
MSMICAKDIRKVYHVGKEKIVALSRISLNIEQGEVCCVLGTSGSGKSTLLNIMAGLEKPSKGSISIAGVDVTNFSEKQWAMFRQKHIGFVFQSYNLLPTLTALENVAMPLVFKGMKKSERCKRAAQMLKAVHLSNRLLHKPTQMSGGQQQRVGIARAFVSRPKIIFADEPTGNLDSKTSREVMGIMVSMAKQYNETLIIVTHDKEIARYADRIITIHDGNVQSDESNISILSDLKTEEEKAI